MIKKLGLGLAVAALVTTGACGSSSSSDTKSAGGSASASTSASASPSSSGDRPTAAEMSASLQKGNKFGSSKVKLPKAKADCAAKLLVGSDLSDAAVTAIAGADNSFQGDSKDTAALAKIRTQLTSCLK